MSKKKTILRERTVWKVKVKTKHFLTDLMETVKDQVGMNLTAYEALIDDACGEAYYELQKQYPDVFDVKFQTCEVKNGAAEVICYGKIMEKVEVEDE